MEYSIANIVATSQIGKIKLSEALKVIKGASNLKKQIGIYYLEGSGGTVFLYLSGAVSIRGGKNINEVQKTFKKLICTLKNFNLLRNEINPILKIVNIVATANLQTKINLEILASRFENIEYNPEVFPGATYRIPELKSTILIFSSGKIVVLAESIGIIEKSIIFLLQEISEV